MLNDRQLNARRICCFLSSLTNYWLRIIEAIVIITALT